MSYPIGRAALACTLAMAATACVNVEATRLDQTVALAPVSSQEVKVYTSPADIGGTFQKIALLEANADGDFTSEGDFIESMRKKAAKLGANGLLLEPGMEPGPLLKTAQLALDVQYTRYRHATAIRTEAAR